jgi:diguanylate cyclase (GGDEF)-like protein
MRLLERRLPRTSNPAVWRRFRVTQAHELRQRLRIVPPIVALLLVGSTLTLAVRYPATTVDVVAVNALAGLILLAFRPLARVASPRGVAALAFMMPTVTGLAMLGTMAAEPAAFATTMATLAIIPIGAPIMLGWDAGSNRRWAVTYGVGVSLIALLTGLGSLSMNQRLDVASLVVACCLVGMLAANLLQGLRLRSIEQEIELRRLNRVLHGYATTDPLTRLRNRRQLDTDVAIIWPSIHRRGVPCAVVIFDLDHFKRLNDERGHAAGDSTLGSVAAELQRQVRGRDSVYRIGGEEFLVLLRDTTLEGGVQVAERIRLAIAELELPSSGGSNPSRLTISGGVAVADVLAVSWDAVVASADASLYRAKAAGRNRVFGPDDTPALVA